MVLCKHRRETNFVVKGCAEESTRGAEPRVEEEAGTGEVAVFIFCQVFTRFSKYCQVKSRHGFISKCCPQVGELWPGTTGLPTNSSRAAPACCSRSREEVVPRPCLLNLPRPVGAGGLAVQTRSLHLRTLLRPEEHGERC